jgi:hypothetical protein
MRPEHIRMYLEPGFVWKLDAHICSRVGKSAIVFAITCWSGRHSHVEWLVCKEGKTRDGGWLTRFIRIPTCAQLSLLCVLWRPPGYA